ncbi:hypothetical protein [Gloeothece verrucosa]|uniref:Uncharacterized protein n=1 Tax=Gloeothece verrucosa (strain PCC 7822) TaxID=497965 RepID=E0UGM3_GLOV7|nr:hypothetical protein [Gloeothece verrucosa]ADN13232.1 conserved hypothetical protein [Gloeothece verrucosa PCC 7822]
MASKIQKLKEELAILENQTSLLYAEAKETYQKYLKTLSQSVQKQLILAVYQICTQSYPQAFLKLSYSQRQKIQENIKSLGKTLDPKLLSYLDKTDNLDSEPGASLNIMEQMLLNLSNTETPEEEKTIEDELLLPVESTTPKNTVINNPNHLVNWCKMLEQGIVTTLNNLSKEVNHLLQQAHILPSQLPPQVLDMAIQAEEAGQPMSGSPNLLNVIVETGAKNLDETAEEPEIPSKITKITALHLRLSEIEFADANLSLHHREIRNLLEKIAQLRKQYQKKQRECAVAEAEAAWRACWYEE